MTEICACLVKCPDRPNVLLQILHFVFWQIPDSHCSHYGWVFFLSKGKPWREPHLSSGLSQYKRIIIIKKKKWQTHKKWVLQKKTSIEGTTETFPLWSQSYRRQSGLTTHSGKPVRGIPKLLCRPRAMFRSGSRILVSKINKINKNTSQHPFLNLKAQLSWRGERRTTLIVCFHSLGIKHWKWSP